AGFGYGLSCHSVLEIVSRHQVHRNSEQCFQIPLAAGQAHKADPRSNVDEQVHVALDSVLAPGDAAEHANVGHPMACDDVSHFASLTEQLLTQGSTKGLYLRPTAAHGDVGLAT